LKLATFDSAQQLFRARGNEVNPLRPPFTGDVYREVVIAGAEASGIVMLLGHPCSMRKDKGRLRDHFLVAAVYRHEPVPASAWVDGHFAKMPLPELVEAGELYVADLEEIGRTSAQEIASGARIACLSDYGVNVLQQRLVWYMTRLEVPTHTFHEAFAHTLEEADLLEDWNDTVCSAGLSDEKSTERFEAFLRADRGDGKTLQSDLKDPQLRSAVRTACRAEARLVAASLDSV